MSNILTVPVSGAIYFSDGVAGSSTIPNLSAGVALKYDNSAGLNITSFASAASASDRFSIDGASGRLFSVSDSLTGSIFSVNDAAGLPIIEVESNLIDKITMGTYGSNALVVNDTKVGIGTATPAEKLSVVGNTTVTGYVSASQYFGLQSALSGSAALVGGNTLGTNLLIGTNDNYPLNLETGGTTKLTITSAGDVGIGSTAPVTKLTVVGGVSATGGFFGPTITAGNFPTAGLLLNYAGSSAGASYIDFFTSGSHSGQSFARLRSSQISGGTGFLLGRNGFFGWNEQSYAGQEDAGTGIMRDSFGVIAQRNSTAPQELRIYKSYTDTANYERFFINTNVGATSATQIGLSAAGTGQNRNLEVVTGGSTRMTVTSAGNVGIGTTTPTNKLEVVSGKVLFGDASDTTGTADNGDLTLRAYQFPQLNLIANIHTGNNFFGLKLQLNNTLLGGILLNIPTGEIKIGGFWGGGYFPTFYSNNVEVMRFTTGGNAGIGTTTPTARLDIADTTLAGSGVLSGSILNLTQTWATSGSPTAIKLNVVNTNSGAASNLLDLQVDGVSKLSVAKSGNIFVNSPTANGGPGGHAIGFDISGTSWGFSGGAGSFRFGTINNAFLYVTTGQQWRFPGPTTIGWAPTTPDGNADLLLARDGAGILAQRNGTNAQELRIYRSYTNASNYERFFISTNVGVTSATQIGLSAVGTGQNRNLEVVTGGNTRMTVTSAGNVGIGVTNPVYNLTIQTADTSAYSYSSIGILKHSSSAADGRSALTFAGDFGNSFRISQNGYTTTGTNTPNHAAFLELFNQNGLFIGTGQVQDLYAQFSTAIEKRFSIYSTLNVSLTNYERLSFKPQSGGAFLIMSEAAGTGSYRDIEIQNGGSTRIDITSGGNIGIGNTTPNERLTVSGNISSSNVVYALGGNSDLWNNTYTTVTTSSANYILDGGNTKGANLLVGTNDSFNLNLETGGTTRWSISSAGDLLAGVDNTYDIGASSTIRPRTGYFGTSVVTPTIVMGGSNQTIGLSLYGIDLAGNSLARANSILLTNSTANASAVSTARIDSPSAGLIEFRVADDTGFASIGALALSLSGQSLSGTSATNLVDLSTTWNTTGNPNAITLNVTNSASGSTSNLLNLQVGSVSQFKVDKVGDVTLGQRLKNTYNQVYLSPNNVDALIAFTSQVRTLMPLGFSNDGSFNDTFLRRRGVANLQIGAADAAAPVAQTLSVQSVAAGTTNLSGTNFTIAGSQGTGTGAGGSIVFQTAPAGSSGTAQNGLSAALTIDSFLNTNSTSNFVVPNVSGKGFWVTGSPTHGGMVNAGGLGGVDFRANAETVLSLVNNAGQRRTAIHIDGQFGFHNDITLARDAANTLAQRNGINPQAFRLYNTYTDPVSAFERLNIKWDTNVIKIGTEKGSVGGSARAMEFQTDGVSRWSIDTSGHLLASTDNSYDIGASGANRPRNIYTGRAIINQTYTNQIINLNDTKYFWEFSNTLEVATFARLQTSPIMQFAGTTASFPAIKRSGAALQVRLADDSGYAALETAGVTVTGTVSAAGDFEVATSLQGVILVSPDSTRWRITVNDNGSLQTTAL